MKKLFIFIPIVYLALSTYAQKAIFLHHSTGGGVYQQGNVEDWIAKYNSDNKTNIEITETSYPNSPWPWDNYPYDFWKLWVDGSCDPNQPGIECLNTLTQKYNIIIFKHCFPGASINSDNGAGNITSNNKTIPNYKLQYRALRQTFDNFPDTKFIVWTLAPLHRLATTSEKATRANEFSSWVIEEWLAEDQKEHPNIFVFDFFGLAAELESNTINGQQYCLKYIYEGSHSDNDSHPNTLANETIGPLFAQKIVDVALSTTATMDTKTSEQHIIAIYPNVLNKGDYFMVNTHLNSALTILVYNLNGQLIFKQKVKHNTPIATNNLSPGVYLVRLQTLNNIFDQKLLVQ